MKLNNKILIAILGGLALIYFATNYFKEHNSKTSLQTDSIAIDTAAVSKIHIKKGANDMDGITFLKNDNHWQVSHGNIHSKTKKGSISNLLRVLQELKIERLVAKTQDQWNSYQVTDSTATIVEVQEGKTGNKNTLYVGKTKYNPPTNQYNQYSLSGSTYIRANSDPKVYGVKGLLSNTFNRDFNSWRNSELLKVNKDDVTQIQFEYPDEKGFVLSKKDSVWDLDGQVIPLEKLTPYLNTISNKSASKFADGFLPGSNPNYQLTLKGNNMDDIIVKTYIDTLSNRYYLQSTLNKDVFFESDSAGVFKQVFVDKNYFME